MEFVFKLRLMQINKEDIGARIKEIRRRLKMTQAELGTVLGVRSASISTYETGAAYLSPIALAKLAEVGGTTTDWIITGKDHLTGLQPVPEQDKIIGFNQNMVARGITPPKGYTKADVFILGGAGNPQDLTSQEPVDSIFLPAKFLRSSIVPVKISGHSMEPMIFDGAYVGVDKDERRVVSGEVYAVHLPYEGMVVKRIYMSTDQIILKSDNPAFPELAIQIDKVDPDNFIFGRVKWVLQEV